MAYTHWRNNFKSLTLLGVAVALSACTHMKKNSDDASNIHRLEESSEVSTQFEWAVQYYEAGQYEQALTSLRILEAEGAKIPSFELIPFYQGMTYMRLDLQERAIPYLERFIKTNPEIAKAQEARLALLQCYEITKNWKALSATAAEVEKFPLYLENKALLKLLWAESLLEQNEIQGAKKNLADASVFLNTIPAPSVENASREDGRGNEDLFGRYAWLNTRIGVWDCQKLWPSPLVKKQAAQKKMHLLEVWIDAKGHCLAKVTEQALSSYSSLSPHWAEEITELFSTSGDNLASTTQWLVDQNYFKTLQETKTAIVPKLRSVLYEQSSIWESYLKNFQFQTLSRDRLEQTFKHFEHLIYQLSIPSS